MKKIIKLRTGETLEIEWNMLALEYLDENYPGGYIQLQKDIKAKLHTFKAQNMFCYAVILANRKEPMTYEDTIKSLTTKAITDIMEILEDNFNSMNNLKKKGPNFSNQKKNHKKKKN